ncbi:MAG: ABC transporter permease, partial [Burkholderiales bacterium]|nr:ABC transporter permease [Burkholderiales bacterium]
MPKLVVLATDWVVLILALALPLYAWRVVRDPATRATWRKVVSDAPALCAMIVLALFSLVTLLDSVHFRRALPATAEGKVFYSPQTESLLDALLARPIAMREVTYSSPLAYQGFSKEVVTRGNQIVRDYPRLEHGGAHLIDPASQWAGDVMSRAFIGLALGGAVAIGLALCMARALAAGHGGFGAALRDLLADRTSLPLRAALITLALLAMLLGVTALLAMQYHVLGTDRTGRDVLVLALKSVRTAFVIGSLSTLATLPLAIALGVLAGYLRGWVDEVIQYLYTCLSSVPNVLLIAACV